LLISKNEHRGKMFEKSLTSMKIRIRLQTSHSTPKAKTLVQHAAVPLISNKYAE